MADCILTIALTLGLTLSIVVIAAIIVVLASGTAGTAAAFSAAVGAVLAEWWFPIAASLLGSLAIAFANCAGGTTTTGPSGIVVEGGATGLPLAVALVWAELKLKLRPVLPPPRR